MSETDPNPVPLPGESPEACVDRILADAERRTTPCGDGDVVWRLFGAGPPLVLIHGGSGGWNHWIRNIPELARHHRLLLPDIPGHGGSAMPPGEVSGPNVAAPLADGLRELLPSDETYSIAGLSFGGIIGGCLAAREKGRVDNLVICGSNGLGLRRAKLSGFKHWRDVDDPAALADAHRTNLAILMFADPAKIDDLAVHLQSINVPMARIKSRLIAVTNVLRDMLPRVTARLSGIWGDGDGYAAPYMEERRALFASIQPGCDIRVIPGAGHWVMYEQPAAFNATLLEMLGADRKG
jgi:pimeloyl-ACP methyl ester carboxylesterase